MSDDAEVSRSIVANGIHTNYHDQGEGPVALLIHGSGPGVSAWANWRNTLPALAQRRRVIAPDIVGFGYTERPDRIRYTVDTWVDHALGLLDALNVESADIVGNSFGGALALALAIRQPKRVRKLVLMGSAGVAFPLTPGLDAVWGYTPSVESMRGLLRIFAFDQRLATEELANLRYRASLRPGVQEAFAAMFPAPRQRWIESLSVPEERLKALQHEVLIIHGREDRVIPLASSYHLMELIPNARLHVFGRCGHWTQIERAKEFNELVASYLSG